MLEENDNKNKNKLLSSEANKSIEGQQRFPSSEIDDHHRIPSPLIHDHHRIPSTLTKYFTLTVLQWPSGILVSPMNEFHIGKPVNNFLDIFNVQPKPRVVWTMDDDVIDGIAVETSTYSYTQPGLMNVKKRLYFEGKREFHEKVLQFNLTMDLLNEDGDVTVLNLKTGNISLICLDPLTTVPPPTTTLMTTTTTTTTSTTTTTTSSTTTISTTTTTTMTTTTTTTTTT